MKSITLNSLQEKYFKIAAVSFVALTIAAVLAISPLFNKKAEAQISYNARNLSGLIAVDSITGGYGAYGDPYGNNLADLIVLQGLFPTSYNPAVNANDLAALIAVDNIVGYGGYYADGAAGGTAGMNKAYGPNLADLLVLNNLFLDP